ncbi:MAG TPA: M14 family zinc carboxypeptidase [Pyrinomonadaceae bacterium]|nr:M14 family zinc carboxypeptidase [Pyrinomonadaceae bacterium]
MKLRTPVLLLLLAFIAFASPARSSRPLSVADVPMPSDVLGFTPGDDRKLASWSQVVEYFEQLDRASDRVIFERLGETSFGKPFVMATISSPENLARLDEFKQIQAQLADPRTLGPLAARDRKAAELIKRGKAIVLITCGIHSTEVGSYLSSMLIAHRLASSNDPEIQNILANTIVLLVPSLNPDGVDIVKNWYDKTLGTPYEGTDPPELYHKYTGHDNNRDWYAFTQVETQLTVDKIHNVWHPQIVHDIHQQGALGSRLFLPPYMAPVEPNVPKQLVAGYTRLGNWMAKELRAKGFEGITTNSTYDAWTPARAYSHYHAGVRMLSETASAKIASPMTLKFSELNAREGYDPQKESATFGPLWRGGEWRLSNITNYMTTAAFLLMRNAAENRVEWLQNFYAIGKEAVRPRRAGELFGFLIEPTWPNDRELINILNRGGVEITPAKDGTGFKIGTRTFPEGTQLIRMDQPYGAFARTLLEVQRYPNLRDATGHPIAPYDVTAHTLPLLMGVEVQAVKAPFKYTPAPSTQVPKVIAGSKACCDAAPGTHLRALYRSSVPSHDEGWTRWIFDKKGIPFATLTDKELRAGAVTYKPSPGVTIKYPAIVIPDQPARALFEGYRAGTMPPEVSGGLGEQGVKTLREFVEGGGTLIFLNRASNFAIQQFKLPVLNVVAGLPRTEFYVPGSILRIELDTSHPLAKNMPKETIAWAEDSPVFQVADVAGSSVPAANAQVVASYPAEGNPLLSGWLLGAEKLNGKAALVDVKMGEGHIILFGFRPQYRAQSWATIPLFFNALNR